MKFETARIHFLGDVFATVAVTVVVGARFKGVGRACRPLTRDRSSCAKYFLRGWPRALIRYLRSWVKNK